MKKNWKQFWTLNRHHAEGFTLVELIVVIAILAILSAVAVPAYSGYITKTHKTNDQKLVSEVSDALQLFYYANPSKGSAYVILTPNGTLVDNTNGISNGAEAMEAVFGAGWASTALSYQKWDESDSGMLGAAAEGGSAVLGSTFTQGNNASELLGNVSALTNAAADLVDGMSGNTLYNAMVGNFANGNYGAFDQLCTDYGIKVEGEGNNRQINATSTQLSNLMVAAVASTYNSGNTDGVSGMVSEYAIYTAAVNSRNTQADQESYAALNAELQRARNSADVRNALDNFLDRSEASGLLDDYDAATAANDQAAIDALMSAIGSANLNADDLNDSNLFTTGKGAQYFNTYISAAQMMAGLEIPANSIAIILNADSGIPEIYCSNPEAYLQGK